MQTIAALITPKRKNRWNGKFSVCLGDFYSLTSYLNVLGFYDFLFLGYTGEFYKLSLNETKEVINFAREYKEKIKEKGKIIINVTRRNEEEIKELIKVSEFADFFMLKFPYKNLNLEDVIKLIKYSPKKVIIYNSSFDDKILDSNELEVFLKEENVEGLKDSYINNYKERKFLVEKYGKIYFYGNDLVFLNKIKNDKIEDGKIGLISGTIQFLPELWKNRDYEKIKEIVEKISEIKKEIEFPIIAKYCLCEAPPFKPLIGKDNIDNNINKEKIKKLEELKTMYLKLVYSSSSEYS